LVEVAGDADALDEPVADAMLVAGVDAVRVAMVIVAFLEIGMPVPALAVPSVTGAIVLVHVVDAVPLTMTVLLMYALGLATDEAEAELTAEATAPCTWKGPK